MEQSEATKNEIVDLLQQWTNEQVRVHVLSHGVGVNCWGYLDLAYDSSVVGTVFAGFPPPPDFVLLYRSQREVRRRDIPVVAVNLNDFTSFGITEDNASRLALIEKKDACIRVVIERSQHESA